MNGIQFRRTLTIVTASMLALISFSFLGGCGNPTASVARCVGAPEQTVANLQRKLTVKGSLRNGKLVTPEHPHGYSMISAELHPANAAKHDKGDILTWATRDADHSGFVSVDGNARADSAWPHAKFGVAEKGAIESRACTGLNVGKTKAQIQCEQSQGSSNVGVGSGGKCSNL